MRASPDPPSPIRRRRTGAYSPMASYGGQVGEARNSAEWFREFYWRRLAKISVPPDRNFGRPIFRSSLAIRANAALFRAAGRVSSPHVKPSNEFFANLAAPR